MALAFAIRAGYAVAMQLMFGAKAFTAYSDSTYFYVSAARNIVERQVVSIAQSAPYIPDARHTPLYPLVLAAAFWLGLPMLAIVLAQDALAAVAVGLLYRVGRACGLPRAAAILAALAVAIEPTFVYWNNLLMSDTLFTVLMAVAVYLVLRGRLVWFGLVLGLASLTRPSALYLYPLFLPFVVLRHGRVDRALGRRIGLSIAVLGLTIAPWLVRNAVQFGRVELAGAGWHTLYLETMEVAKREGIDLAMPAAPPGYPQPDLYTSDLALVPFFRAETFRVLAAYPWTYARYHAEVVVRGLLGTDYGYLSGTVLKTKLGLASSSGASRALDVGVAVLDVVRVALLVCAAASLRVAPQARLAAGLFLGLFLFNGMISGYGLMATPSRISMPFTPLLFLLAGATLVHGYRRISRPGRRAGPIGATVPDAGGA